MRMRARSRILGWNVYLRHEYRFRTRLSRPRSMVHHTDTCLVRDSRRVRESAETDAGPGLGSTNLYLLKFEYQIAIVHFVDKFGYNVRLIFLFFKAYIIRWLPTSNTFGFQI